MANHHLPGSPPVPVVLRRSGRARRISLRVSQLDGRVTLTLPLGVPEAEALALMIRPERLHLVESGAGEGQNTFQCQVSEIVYQGDSFLLYARLEDGHELAVRGALRSDTFAGLPKVGDSIALALDHKDTVIIADGDL